MKNKERVMLKFKVSHPDPKVEKQGAKALVGLIKALGKLTGEKVEILKPIKKGL